MCRHNMEDLMLLVICTRMSTVLIGMEHHPENSYSIWVKMEATDVQLRS